MLEAWQAKSSRNRRFYHLLDPDKPTRFLCGMGHNETVDTDQVTETQIHPTCEITARRLNKWEDLVRLGVYQ